MLYEAHGKYTVLVICTGNSARSIMVEALFNHLGSEYFHAFSAGSHPTGKVNPFALKQISHLDLDYEPVSKSWDVFAGKKLDFIITVCGNAKQEICPCFAGSPKHIHWGEPDPATVLGTDAEKTKAFSDCFNAFKARLERLMQQIITNEITKKPEQIMQKMLMVANG